MIESGAEIHPIGQKQPKDQAVSACRAFPRVSVLADSLRRERWERNASAATGPNVYIGIDVFDGSASTITLEKPTNDVQRLRNQLDSTSVIRNVYRDPVVITAFFESAYNLFSISSSRRSVRSCLR